ncbi:MAG: flippase [Candidatus Kerfeldbacteria bacterium]|nr:flippase [Candidatus Kerfeldbacteria bacterium]
MSTAKSVFKNVSYLLIARTAFRFLTAIALIYAANYLGKERYGMFETATAWANMFLALNDLGMSTLIVREGARDEKKMAIYFGNTLLVETVLSVILFFIIIGIGVGIGYSHTTIVLMALLGASNLIFEFRKVMRGVFRVALNLKIIGVVEVINGTLFCFFTFGIIWLVKNPDRGLLGIAHTSLWVDLFCIVLLFAYTRKLVKPQFDTKLILPMIKQAYVFTLYNMFFMLYFQIDQIIISIIRDQGEVGIYSAAAKLVSMFLFVPLMLFQVTMPIMYRYSKNNMEKYTRAQNLTNRYLAAIGIPAGIGLWFLAPAIIPLVYHKPEFLAAVPVLQVFGWFLAIRFVGIGHGNSLTTTDHQGLRAGIQLATLVLNVVLDIFLVRNYGATGAAIATLITEITITVSSIYLSNHFLRQSNLRDLASLLPIIGATVVMFSVLYLSKGTLPVIVLVILGAFVYLFALWIFRFFSEEDKIIMKQILTRKIEKNTNDL